MKIKPQIYTAYYDEAWRTLTLRKPAAEWLNAGMPDISDEQGYVVLTDEGEFTGETMAEYILIYEFLRMSVASYHTKYGDKLVDGAISVDEFYANYATRNSSWSTKMLAKTAARAH